MHNLLIIDDDQDLCSMLRDYFSPEGFKVLTCNDGSTGLDMALSGVCDMVILDVCLPDKSGFEILADLRNQSQLPVLMLTGRDESVDRVVGLEMGADDYQPKPFIPRELLARVRSILRRTQYSQSAPPSSAKTLTDGDLALDLRTHSARLGSEELHLTFVEFTILKTLLESRCMLVTREELSKNALGRELTVYDRSLDVHISNLRKKLGPAPDGGKRISTIRGTGYIYNSVEVVQASQEDEMDDMPMMGSAHGPEAPSMETSA